MTKTDELNELFEVYLPKVIKLAEYNISQKYKRVFDGDDIGLTVMRTVVRRMNEGEFNFDDEKSLWKQLATITLRRISNKVRDENAQKRGGGKKVDVLEELYSLSKEPDPSHAVEMLEVVDKVGEKLDDRGKKVLELRMTGCSYVEIAKELGTSERLVGRKLELIRQVLTDLLDDSSEV